MESRFTAQFLYVGEEDWGLMLGLADDQYETRRSILSQREINPTPQDAASGPDGVYWELDGNQARSHYDGIERIVMSDKTFVVVFEAETAERMGIPQRLSIGLELSSTDLPKLRDGLRRLIPALLTET